ncbi:FAD-dependent oxidoreductase [Pseudactinotalea sp. Z1739]|uniref:FAD-dependent oxidoreductase n=1 Tax=Pseudactinotalea sp. Z1739 TaxID=3413028 RepID=UPI003C7A0354
MKTRDRYDVIVAGGGTAGAIAAIAAARTGARTLVVEPHSYLGGNLSLGMNLLGAADAEGYWALGGIGRELIERLIPIHGATAPQLDPQFGSILAHDPEMLKVALLEMAVAEELDILFHAIVVGCVSGNGSVTGLEVATKAGVRTIEASAIVDATGDADILAAAGGSFEHGRGPDRKSQPASRIFRVGGVDMKRVFDYLAENPADIKPPRGWTGDTYDIDALRATPGATIEAFGDLIRRAKKAGDWTIPRWRLGLYTLPDRDEVGVNVTRVHGIDGTNPDDVSRAEVVTVLQMAEVVRFLQKYVPGFEHARISSAPHQVGIRETRRLRGSHILDTDDVMSGRDFDDQVGRGAYPLDVHDVEPGKGGSVLWPIKRSFGIPLGCLVPEELDGLVVAGRAISATHEAAGSTRGQAVCMVTGHAAGTLAALASRQQSVHKVPHTQLQATLLEQGAILERSEHIDAHAH